MQNLQSISSLLKKMSDKKVGWKKQSASFRQKTSATLKKTTNREGFLRQEMPHYERIGNNTDDGHLSEECSADHSSSQLPIATYVDHQLLPEECSYPKTSSNNVKLIPDADSHGKRKASEIIAYVHNVSPVKRNKKNMVDYCDLLLQMPNETKRAICFSKFKWPILLKDNWLEHHSEFQTLPTHLTKNGMGVKSS